MRAIVTRCKWEIETSCVIASNQDLPKHWMGLTACTCHYDNLQTLVRKFEPSDIVITSCKPFKFACKRTSISI